MTKKFYFAVLFYGAFLLFTIFLLNPRGTAYVAILLGILIGLEFIIRRKQMTGLGLISSAIIILAIFIFIQQYRDQLSSFSEFYSVTTPALLLDTLYETLVFEVPLLVFAVTASIIEMWHARFSERRDLIAWLNATALFYVVGALWAATYISFKYETLTCHPICISPGLVIAPFAIILNIIWLWLLKAWKKSTPNLSPSI